MAGKKTRRVRPDPSLRGLLAETLAAACADGQDFIVTLETCDDGKRLLHVMTGHLITPCMLGTLSNRCELPGPQENRHRILDLA